MRRLVFLLIFFAALIASILVPYFLKRGIEDKTIAENKSLIVLEDDGIKLRLYTRDGSLRVGENQLFLELEGGRKLEQLYFYMPPMPGMGEMREEASLKQVKGGRYEGRVNLSMPGSWQLVVQVDGRVIKKDISIPFHPERVERRELRGIILDPEKSQLIGIRTAEVKVQELRESFNTVGYVSYDLSRIYEITLRSDGWVLDTFGRFEGELVEKGAPLMKILSPESKVAEAELKLVREMGKKELEGAVLERLSYLKAGEVVSSPYNGVILEKKVSPGGFIRTGDTAYRIADISKLWVIAEVPQEKAGMVKKGMEALISPAGANRTYSARVDYIFPEANKEAGTIRVRISLQGVDRSLRINQLVDVYFERFLGKVLAVPESAVVDTGRRQVVFVEIEPGLYQPRFVRVGRRVEDYYEVLEGLKEGEKVVVKGAFLLDSEAQIKGFYGQEVKGHEHHH